MRGFELRWGAEKQEKTSVEIQRNFAHYISKHVRFDAEPYSSSHTHFGWDHGKHSSCSGQAYVMARISLESASVPFVDTFGCHVIPFEPFLSQALACSWLPCPVWGHWLLCTHKNCVLAFIYPSSQENNRPGEKVLEELLASSLPLSSFLMYPLVSPWFFLPSPLLPQA